MSCAWSPGTLSAMLALRAMVTIAIAVVLNSWCNPHTHLAPAAPGDERGCGVAHDEHHDPGRQRARLATRGGLTGGAVAVAFKAGTNGPEVANLLRRGASRQ